MSPTLLTTEEVAACFKVKPSMIRSLSKKRELQPAEVRDGVDLYDLRDVEDYIDSRRADTAIYFVQMEHSRHVKIGMARNVAYRVASLQTANPEKLTLLAFTVVVRGRQFEAGLHRLLKPYRMSGEWFRPGPWLDRLLAAQKGRGPGMSEGTVLKALKE